MRSKQGAVWKALNQSSINDITITDFHFTTIPTKEEGITVCVFFCVTLI